MSDHVKAPPGAMPPPYANPMQAYKHLTYWVSNPNLPRERNEAFVAIHVNGNYAHARLYESFETISRFHNSCIFQDNIVVSLDHLRYKYTRVQCRKIYRLFNNNQLQLSKSKDSDVHLELWNFLHQDERVKLTKMKPRNKTKSGNGYMFHLDKITPQVIGGFPKQARQILGWIVQDQKSAYDRTELELWSTKLPQRGLKTKQHGFKVVQFYLSQFYDAGLLEYPRKDYGNSDEE